MRTALLIMTFILALFTTACSSGAVGEDAGLDAEVGDNGDPGADPGLDAGADVGDPGSDMDAGYEEPNFDGDAGDGSISDGDAIGDSDVDGGDDGAQVGWRSLLYPEDWTPELTDSEGRFLHDFSYAGYHNGEVPLPVVNQPLFDVVSAFGADSTGQTDATSAIQAAIDEAAAQGGGVVHFPLGTYRLDGMLTVSASNTILRGDGPDSTMLYFTRDQDMSNKANITLYGGVQSSLDIPLAVDAESRATAVEVDDASGLQIGDDVQIGFVISDEFIADHGMQGTWVSFNGQWKPFFRRVVTGIDSAADPDIVELDVPLRYPVLTRDGASLRKVSGFISECGVESISLSNAVTYDSAWSFDRAHVLTIDQAKDCWVRAVHSFHSPLGDGDYHLQSGGILISNSKQITVSDCRMEKAEHRGGGGNGYLFEVLKSNEVLVKDCSAVAGRHNFIQNWDFGTNGCVFLRCHSQDGRMLAGSWDPIGTTGYCEYHHSLATANLVDSCELLDGWIGFNRHAESSGAGHAVTQSVFWNNHGGGTIKSLQYGWGYVIGVNDMNVRTSLTDIDLLYNAMGTEPEDWVEASPDGTPLLPESLYQDQLRRRQE
ncbi:MAG TPA: glycosyl hydrolase family 28-related protein [Myxococcota bacterium]|nr:glycosyl hydrolase family 28-related protein [Myxococcota bacterium]